jgi:hypothetical protein
MEQTDYQGPERRSQADATYHGPERRRLDWPFKPPQHDEEPPDETTSGRLDLKQ